MTVRSGNHNEGKFTDQEQDWLLSLFLRNWITSKGDLNTS